MEGFRPEREPLIVYSKERCVQCTATIRALGKHAIDHVVIDLESVPEKLQEFIQEGLLEAPIVDTGEERWSGYRPDRIAKYA